VIGVDIDRAKVERALGRGAVAGGVDGTDDIVEIVRAASRGRGADAIVITASAPTNAPLVLAGDLARDRARVAVVGMVPLEIPRKSYFDKEVEVVVSRSYGPGRYDPEYEERGHDYPIGYVRWTERRNFEAVIDAIARRRVEVRSLITHRFPFEDALDAYALVTGEVSEPHLGVVLTYGDRRRSEAESAPAAPAVARGHVGVAVIGTGAFATSVLVPRFAEAEGARIVATVSGRGLSARHVADQHDADVEASLDAALARADVTALVIATRHDLHAAQAIRALDAGRDVFLEKPAAIDEEQLRLLGRAVAAARGRLMIGFNRRFAPFAEEVRRTFAGRRAGLVMTARVNAGSVPAGSWIRASSEGGGRVVGEGCHFVDLLTSFAGAPPRRVSAHAIGPEGAFARDDNLAVSMDFADGSVATLVYTAMGDARVGKERYEIFGEGTVAIIDDWRRLEITRRGKTTVHRALRADKGHAAEIDAFVRACRRGEPSPTPWASVEVATRATFAIEAARAAGCTVEL
jgi:predicted dehydrogenase